MNFQKIFSMTFCLIIVAIISGCNPTDSNDPKLPVLTVGIQVSPAMALVMVAEEKQFFDSSGVDVDIREFTAGKFALQAFLGGSLDVAISGEVPVTLATLRGEKFKVITQVVERTINECRVVVRKEKGLDTPESYFGDKKRKLATSFGGGPEFFTYEFLKSHQIDIKDVELVSQKPQDMPAALVSGSVDAISIFDPQARQAELRMGEKAITFKNSEIYSELYVADVQPETIKNKPTELKAFLKGLQKASVYIENNPEDSKKILVQYTKLDKQIVDDIWDNFIFKPAINDLFVEYTTAQAQWAIDKGDYPSTTTVPNFRDILYTDFLEEIDPSLVTVK